MPARIVIHPGFHKTGTTSVQKTLRANRAALKPDMRIVLRPAMLALCEAARGYSDARTPLDLGLVSFEAAALAESWKRDKRLILLSSEDLCGHMPGRKGLGTYDAAPQLMQTIVAGFAAALPDAPISLHFTTRAADPWLRSCYVQHLRATRITLGEMQYMRNFRASARLDEIVSAVAAALPGTPVTRASLEDTTQDRLGPLGALLREADLAPDKIEQLTALPPANTAPPAERIAFLLELNRSDLSDMALRNAKKRPSGKAS